MSAKNSGKDTQSIPSLKKREYKLIDNPFKNIPKDQFNEKIKEYGNNKKKEYDDSLEKLESIIIKHDPVLLLSVFSFYGLVPKVSEEVYENEPPKVHQHLIEILQALLLKHKTSEFEISDNTLVPARDFEEIVNLLEKVSTSFHEQSYSEINFDEAHELNQFWAINFIRAHTQSIRGWGYPEQITRIVQDLFAPIDIKIYEIMHIKISLFYKMIENITNIMKVRLNELFRVKQQLIHATNTEEYVSIYRKEFPKTEISIDGVNEVINSMGLEFNQFKMSLNCHSDLSCRDIYTFSINDFIKNYEEDINNTDLTNFIKILSLSLGELNSFQTDHVFLNNPIWKQPFISLGDDLFFYPIPMLFACYCLDIFGALLIDHPDLKDLYHRRRSEYLQEETERILKKAFPTAEIFPGNMWGDIYENDILLKIDSYLFVIELKSGQLTESARRGSESRIRSNLNEIIAQSSIQTNRFIDFLKEQSGKIEFNTKSGKINKMDLSNIYEIHGFNITFEELSLFGSQSIDLQTGNLLPDSISLVPSMSFTELESVFEILETNCEKIHYLVRRSQFSKNAKVLGDEMDLLAFYIDTGFNVGDDEYGGMVFYLWGRSEDFDPYFMQEWTGKEVVKPRRFLTKWWRSLIEKLEEKQPPKWSEFGYILLNIPFEDQQMFEKKFKNVQYHVKKSKSGVIKNNAFVLEVGPKKRRDCVIGLAYNNVSKNYRKNMINNVVDQVVEKSKSMRVIVIGQNVDTNDYPYSIIAYLPKKSPS